MNEPQKQKNKEENGVCEWTLILQKKMGKEAK